MKNYNLKSNKVAYTQQKLWLKTICFFLLISLFSYDLKAQYFQFFYGASNLDETLTDWETTSSGKYLMTGYDVNGKLIIILADNTGFTNLPVPTIPPMPPNVLYNFNLKYELKYPLMGYINTGLITVTNAKCVETATDKYMIVCETFLGEILLVTVDNSTPLSTGPAITNIEILYNNLNALKLGNIHLNNSGNLYITGSNAHRSGSFDKVFAAKVSLPNTITWSNTYDVNSTANIEYFGADIIENGSDAIIVGHDVNNNDAFFLPIDNTNGNPNFLSPTRAEFFGYNDVYNQSFNSITVDNSTTPSGFVIGGTTNKFNTTIGTQSMLMQPLTAGYVPNTELYVQHSGSAPVTNSGIVQRQNTSGNYINYLIGTADLGAGTTELVTYPFDPIITPPIIEEYTNEGIGGVAIDIDNFNTDFGLTMFGNINHSVSGSTSQDLFMAKTYYNGVTCSTSVFSNVNINNNSNPAVNDLFTNASPLSINKEAGDLNPMFEFYRDDYCSSSSVGGGSNAFLIPSQPIKENIGGFFPNPFYTSVNSVATIELKSGLEREIIVSIYDILGREFYNNTIQIGKDKSKINLDLNEIVFVPGMYMLHINDNGQFKTTAIQIR